ncbi:MAG: substrate-binding domain-containing protein [Candidatus Acidiferrales bacterium]
MSVIQKMHSLRWMVVLVAIAAGHIATSSSRAQTGAATNGAPLLVYTSDGFKPALQALIPQIERALGRKVSPEFDASNVLQKKIESGERFDVAILAAGNIDALISQGKLAAGTRAGLGRAGIGVGLRAGAPKPDIGTPEAMKRTLLSAHSIEFNRDGASAVHINEMVDRLGIAQEVKPKFVLVAAAGLPQMDVAAGKSEMVITLIPEIKDFSGLELVGPLPGDLQSYINFSAAIAKDSPNQESSRALIKFISSPSVIPTLKQVGIDPASER